MWYDAICIYLYIYFMFSPLLFFSHSWMSSASGSLLGHSMSDTGTSLRHTWLSYLSAITFLSQQKLFRRSRRNARTDQLTNDRLEFFFLPMSYRTWHVAHIHNLAVSNASNARRRSFCHVLLAFRSIADRVWEGLVIVINCAYYCIIYCAHCALQGPGESEMDRAQAWHGDGFAEDETRLGECYVQWPGFGLVKSLVVSSHGRFRFGLHNHCANAQCRAWDCIGSPWMS